MCGGVWHVTRPREPACPMCGVTERGEPTVLVPEKTHEALLHEHEALVRALRGVAHGLYEHPRRWTRRGKMARALDRLWEGC